MHLNLTALYKTSKFIIEMILLFIFGVEWSTDTCNFAAFDAAHISSCHYEVLGVINRIYRNTAIILGKLNRFLADIDLYLRFRIIS